MDYEKAYKESFEAAKGLHEAGNALTKKQMEIVFPQLAESEDERIRKDIINLIYWLKGNPSLCSQYYKDRYDDMLAYLEKQKELFESGRGLYYYDGEKTVYMGYPATEENPYDFAMSQQEEKKEPNYTKHNALFDKCVENCDPKVVEEVNKRVDDIMNMPELSAFEQALTNFIGYWKDDEEKWPSKFVKKHGKHILDMAREELQKEQKPAEWILPEEFEEAVYKVANFISPFDSQEELRKVSHRFAEQLLSLAKKELDKPAEWSEDIIKKAVKEVGLTQHQINWFKTNVFPPKQEWSEEDEQWLESIIREYERRLSVDKDHAAVIQIKINFLKSLRPQPKQEWSEDDEKMAYFVNQFLEFHESSDPTAKSCKKWFNNRFKSLRPQSKIHYWTEEEIEPIISDYLAGREHYGGMLARLRCLKPKSHWKPTEEQMRALQRAVNKLAKSDVADSVRLSIMYDNLKKLM